MLKRISAVALVAGFALAWGYAAPNSKVTIPVNRTNPTDGKLMYQNYCAPCHGADGRGGGPAATAMKAPPTDLTRLSQTNHGAFPKSHIASMLQFGSSLPAHGSAAMPVWGHLFDRIEPGQSAQTALRIGNLTRYLESMQAQ